MKADKNKNINELISEIDKAIHSPARLMIMTYLNVVECGDAVYLMNQTGLTWGNLSTHISKLEEAGYVDVKKEFVNKKPRTVIQLTELGKESFAEYKSKLQEFLEMAK